MTEPVSLLLVDDQKLLREGFRALLEREADLTVAGEAGDGQEAVELYAELGPDVVLMDVQMPNVDGVTAIQRIHERDPEAKDIILTTFDNYEYVIEGVRAGALGYLLKTMSGEELAAAIRIVQGGGAFLEPSATRKVVDALGPGRGRAAPREAEPPHRGEQAEFERAERDSFAEEEAEGAPVARVDRRREEANSKLTEPLSRREQEVLLLIAEGLSNRRIANRLNLAEGTIKNYVSSLIGKLNAQDRTQAALMSKELGLIP